MCDCLCLLALDSWRWSTRYVGVLSSGRCPDWDPHQQPGACGVGGRPRTRNGARAAGPQFRSAWRAGQTRIGTQACQTRIGEGPGQIRIGNTGGSNTKREMTAPKKKRKETGMSTGFYQRLFTGVLTKVFTGQQKTLVFTQVFT